jgi:hypothetical protein
LFEAVASVLQREVDSEPLHRYIQIRQEIEPYRRRLSRWSVLRQKPVKEKKIEGLLNWELVDVARRFFEEYDLSFDRLVDYLRNGQLEWGQRVEEQKEGLVFYGDFSPFNSLMDAVEGVLLLEAEQSERVLSQKKLTRAAKLEILSWSHSSFLENGFVFYSRPESLRLASGERFFQLS